ncbi:MAG: hypothetical protein HGN29_09140 [Asgard group archaeon]|nr:hypothetical protein [Asgard group archaeon]
MKNKRNNGKKVLSIFLVFLLFMLYLSLLSRTNLATYLEENNSSNLTYTIYLPIEIDSDADFISYGFPGDGSPGNPYRIEDYHISADSGTAIEITSTTKNFVIQNCLIEGFTIAIYISSVGLNTVQILENTIRDTHGGIILYSASYAIIANNTLENNEWGGIHIEYSPFVVIEDNEFTQGGISIMYDVDLSEVSTMQINDNTLNGKPIAWFVGNSSLTFSASDYGQIFLIDCSDIQIINQEMKSPSKGIFLFYCNDVIIENNYCGIEVTGSNNVNIAHNKLEDRTITVHKSTNVIIENNQYDEDGDFGIYVYEFSSNVIIRNNLCQGQNIGIYVDLSTYCIIDNNTCKDNWEYGMYLPMSEYIIIRNNFIETSTQYGMYFAESNYCEIYQNVIKYCTEHGINLAGWGDTSDNNKIYRNIFIENNNGGTQVKDDGLDNIWYNTSTEKGNYWDDWSGTGDYPIGGTAGTSDLYPLEDTDDDGMDPKWEVEKNLDPWNDDSAEDPDDDDLTNIEEYALNTHPMKSDTDSDGLKDGEEVNEYETDPKNDDTDEDGLKDGEEVQVYFTNPNNNDTDLDGLLDGDEVNDYETDPTEKDSDADGLTDGDEVLIHLTDPNNNDTDGDGISDGEEVENSYDPLNPDNPNKSALESYVIMIAIVVISVIVKKKK